ncbi:phosphopantetheine-binding protein [Gordonia humi]|uniref:phosphopantetheine-binding protein n=1 Tax=Gordonia humi TaxID=686429 RepID=UPI003615E42A
MRRSSPRRRAAGRRRARADRGRRPRTPAARDGHRRRRPPAHPPSGKLDRRALAELEQSSPDEPAADRRTWTPAESVVADRVEELLGSPVTDLSADFFGLGGDSIAALRLVSRCRRDGLILTTGDVFAAGTLTRLARLARTADTAAPRPRVRRRRCGGADADHGRGARRRRAVDQRIRAVDDAAAARRRRRRDVRFRGARGDPRAPDPADAGRPEPGDPADRRDWPVPMDRHGQRIARGDRGARLPRPRPAVRSPRAVRPHRTVADGADARRPDRGPPSGRRRSVVVRARRRSARCLRPDRGGP